MIHKQKRLNTINTTMKAKDSKKPVNLPGWLVTKYNKDLDISQEPDGRVYIVAKRMTDNTDNLIRKATTEILGKNRKMCILSLNKCPNCKGMTEQILVLAKMSFLARLFRLFGM